jgi:hypothetical protein
VSAVESAVVASDTHSQHCEQTEAQRTPSANERSEVPRCLNSEQNSAQILACFDVG